VTKRGRWLKSGGLVAVLVLVGTIALPAAGQGPRGHLDRDTGLSHFSQVLAARRAVAESQPGTVGVSALGPASRAGAGPLQDLFNRDDTGLPQNEESISVCRKSPKYVLGGTNDYRGLLDPEGNFTGWHFSTNGGASVRNEGLLPPVEIAGQQVESGGDPITVVEDRSCDLYAGGLHYDSVPEFDLTPNGVGVLKSDPQTLANCPGGAAPSCWPTRKAVATSTDPNVFLDKPWFDVGESGNAGRVVWVAYAEFILDETAPLGFTSASIKAVRCDGDLQQCTDPILISGTDEDVQFADVTIADDGRTYISWSQIKGELEQAPETFIHKVRIAEPGSTQFGPTRVVYRETKAIPFEPAPNLHANDFRIATYPKNEVQVTGNDARIFLVWDACRYRVFGETVCEEAVIKLSYSDDDGRSWTSPRTLSAGGDNYFPAIVDNPGDERLAVAYFTNRFDSVFHNRQDVELVIISGSGAVQRRQRLTPLSNESEADPVLGGTFIGDYIEVEAEHGRAYVHYNANYRHEKLLGEGIPISQQDNFLARTRL
jgi:hypothetical protein